MTKTNASESALSVAVEGSPLDVKTEVARINDLAAKDFAYEEEGHRRTYQRVATMLKFVEQVHNNPQYAEAWDTERSLRQVSIPSEGANVFLQYVKVLDGRFRPDLGKVEHEGESVTPWEHNRSSEKLAKVIRFCIENGVKSDVAADYIGNYAHTDHEDWTRMYGIEQADKQAHPAPERVSTLKAAEQKALREAKGIFELPSSIEDHVQFHGDLAVVILRRDSDRIVILDDAGLSPNQVISAVKKRKNAFTARKSMEMVITPALLEKYRARIAEKAVPAATN